MSGFTSTAWWFWIGGGVLALLGFTLLLWALFWDQSKGRRRCPHCWYDLIGTPQSLTCSECGRTAKRERKFRKTRRRWGWATLAIVILLIAGVGIWGGDFAQRGWKAMPTTGLMLLMPVFRDTTSMPIWADDAFDELIDRCDQSPLTRRGEFLSEWQWRFVLDESFDVAEKHPPVFRAGPAPITDRHKKLLFNALRDGHVSRFDYTNRFLAMEPVRVIAKCRKPWPVGYEVPIELTLDHWYAEIDSATFALDDGTPLHCEPASFFGRTPDSSKWLVQVPEGADCIHVNARLRTGRIEWRYPPLCWPLPPITTSLDVVMQGPAKEFIRGKSSAFIDEVVRAGFAWSLSWQNEKCKMRLTLDEQCILHLNAIGDQARVFIRHHGKLVTLIRGSFKHEPAQNGQPDLMACELDLPEALKSMAEGTTPDDGGWTLVFTIDLIEHLLGNSGRDRWLDEIEVPIRWADAHSE